jgi:large subunit ribosomal protein L13
MANIIKRQKVQMDATGQSMGRLASDIAMKLMGKHKPTYTPHIDEGDFVEVAHARDMRITGNKIDQKVYQSYSGYPGGLKTRDLKGIMAKNPADALRRAVKSMLPKNRLQKDRLKRLSITND